MKFEIEYFNEDNSSLWQFNRFDCPDVVIARNIARYLLINYRAWNYNTAAYVELSNLWNRCESWLIYPNGKSEYIRRY